MKSSPLFERMTNNWPAKVLSVVAAILLFLFYRISSLEQRYVTVPLKLVTNELYVPSNDLPHEVRVSLRGSSDTVFLIREEDIEAYVDLSSFHGEGIFRAPVKIRKKGASANVDVEVKVDPLELTVNIERLVTKSVQVTPSVKGFPARGFELGQYFVSPSAVTIEGPRSRVDAITTVSTDDVNVEGKSGDFTTPVDVAIADPTVNVVGNQLVEFHGAVQEITTLRTYDPVDVLTENLSPDLRLNSDMTSGSVSLEGTELEIEKIRPGDISIGVDCASISVPGTYILPAKPNVPQGMMVLSFTPERITLTVSASGEGHSP